MPLIQQLIKKQTRHWDSKLVSDPVQDKLLEIIEAKRKKTKRPAKAKASEPKATTNNVVVGLSSLRWTSARGRSSGASMRRVQTAQRCARGFSHVQRFRQPHPI
jgi:DNA end-binding protein Ku